MKNNKTMPLAYFYWREAIIKVHNTEYSPHWASWIWTGIVLLIVLVLIH